MLPELCAFLQEMEVQGFLAGPIAANLLTIGIMNIITLSFVGHFGTEVQLRYSVPCHWLLAVCSVDSRTFLRLNSL